MYPQALIPLVDDWIKKNAHTLPCLSRSQII